MKKQILITIITCISFWSFAQNLYQTKTGLISFFSETPVRNIEAINNLVASLINTETGEVVFSVPVKEFKFEKSLMEEHFNENYMESTKFPKATFKGKITNMSAVNLAVNGDYRAAIQGDITIHGVTKPIQADATLSVSNGLIHGVSKFDLLVADYNIEVPKVVRDNVAKTVQVTVDINYKPMEQ